MWLFILNTKHPWAVYTFGQRASKKTNRRSSCLAPHSPPDRCRFAWPFPRWKSLIGCQSPSLCLHASWRLARAGHCFAPRSGTSRRPRRSLKALPRSNYCNTWCGAMCIRNSRDNKIWAIYMLSEERGVNTSAASARGISCIGKACQGTQRRRTSSKLCWHPPWMGGREREREKQMKEGKKGNKGSSSDTVRPKSACISCWDWRVWIYFQLLLSAEGRERDLRAKGKFWRTTVSWSLALANVTQGVASS